MSERAQRAKAGLVRYGMLNREKFPDLELTVAEVAVLLAVGDEQVRVWARKGMLPGCIYGKEWRFTWTTLDELKRRLRNEAEERRLLRQKRGSEAKAEAPHYARVDDVAPTPKRASRPRREAADAAF